MASNDPAAPLFRRAGTSRSDFSNNEELRGTLQRRLRAVTWVSAVFNLGAALSGLFSTYMRARTASNPFSVGSSIFYVLIGVVFLLVAQLLRPSRPRSVRWLRWYEAVLFGIGAVSIIALNNYDYSTIRGLYELAPIDIALGHASYWTFQIVAYGVLIPNSSRRTAIALALFVAGALVADAIAIATGNLPTSLVPLVFIIKLLVLSLSSFIVWFGSYRYETVARREAAARELGQYTLGAPIGAGGMGEVFRGEHRMLRRPVAIKFINSEQAGSNEALMRFEREAQATAQLTHPNTVQVFDYGRADDGTFFCVMEYLDGRTLDAIVRRDGPMAPARAVHVLTQLCGALAEAHDRGLVHRDIKPGNVIVGPRGGVPDVAKLLDFGLVTTHRVDGSSSGVTQVGAIVGTPEYMSPEQCSGADAVGPASDLYSLGALGYFLVAGRSPFAGRNVMQMLAAQMYETPPAPSTIVPNLPAELDAILMKALAKDPAERFRDAREMAADLAGV